MRRRRPQLVITFATTLGAMIMEAYCEEHGIGGRLIPLPGAISAGCGLCWKTEPDQKEYLIQELQKGGIAWEQMWILDLV